MSLSQEDKKRLGGSDVAAVLGLSRYGGPLSVWGRVVHGVEREGSEHAIRGKWLEATVLKWYHQNHAERMDTGISLQGLAAHERASLDALAYLRVPDTRWRVVEAKTASWRVMSDWGEPGTQDIPEAYLLQVQWYQGCLRQDPRGRERADDVADVPALVGGEFNLWRVPYDAELFGLIRDGMARFWRDYVVTGREPPATALSSDADFIRKRFPRNRTKHLEWSALPEETQWALIRHRQALRELSEIETERDAAGLGVKLLLGDSSGVQGLPGGARLDWKKNRDSQVTDWEAVARGMIDGELSFDTLVKRYTTTKDGNRPLVWAKEKTK